MFDNTQDTADPNPNVPSPVGAVEVYDWDLPEASRYWVGTKRIIDIGQRADEIVVAIDGLQHADGRVERFVNVDQMHPDYPITPQQAREVAAALAAAADELESAIELEWSQSG